MANQPSSVTITIPEPLLDKLFSAESTMPSQAFRMLGEVKRLVIKEKEERKIKSTN